MTKVAPIQALSETLLTLGAYDTLRKATAAIKRGEVYVADYRVANNDALLVITAPTTIRCNESIYEVEPL